MKFQIPEVYPSNYMLTADFYLWIAVVIIGLICVLFFLVKIKKVEAELQKPFLGGLCLFLLFLTFQRVAYIISIKLPDTDYNFWTNVGYSCSLTGMAAFFFGVESSIIKKTKYMLTIISGLGVLISILSFLDFIDREISMKITYIISTLSTVIIVILFAWMISKSTGSIRKKSMITFIGIVILFAGIMMDGEMVYGFWPTMPLLLPPILNMAGLITITYIQVKN